ncbi:tyrosine-type recombinase/integrase [Chloroflexota bacterium]
MRSIGHIKETSDKGVYRIVLSLGRDATGKRLRQWVTVRGNRRDAEKRLAELQHEYNSGNYVKPGRMLVAKFLDRWLTDYAKPNLSPKGYERYESIVRVHLKPALGNISLTQLKPEHIQALYTTKLNAGLSAKTVRYYHVVLHKALQTALKWGLVVRNATDGADIPRNHQVEIRTWDETEIMRFLETARDSQYYALFHTAIFTGARRSELLGLRWRDVDFVFSQLQISRGLHQLTDGNYVFTQPKSAGSRRTIALSPSVILTLQEHHDKMAMDRVIVGIPLSEEDLVFSQPDGRPFRPNTISRAWRIIATKAGVSVIRLHDARHTHASLMLKQGVHPKVVSERLGHSSIQITLDTYSHVTPGLQEAAAKRFDEAIQKARVEIG